MRTSIAVYELRSIQDRLARIAEKCGKLADELRTVEANLDVRIGLAIESLPTVGAGRLQIVENSGFEIPGLVINNHSHQLPLVIVEPSDLPTPWIDTTGLELELDVEGK